MYNLLKALFIMKVRIAILLFLITTSMYCSQNSINEETSYINIDSLVNYRVDSILKVKSAKEKLFGSYNYIPDTIISNYLKKNPRSMDINGYNTNGEVYFEDTFKFDKFYSSGYRMCVDSGIVTRELLFKGKNRDSLMFDYYSNYNLESKGFYRDGKKNGIFIEMYPNGNLKSEAFYQNDMLIDNKIEYYPNRKIKAIGNDHNGIYREYDINGRLESEIVYNDGHIINQKKFYPEESKNGERKTPKSNPALKIDSLIDNNTDLKVKLLYALYKKDIDSTWQERWNSLIARPKLSIGEEVSIHFGSTIIIINNDKIQVCDSCLDFNDKKNINTVYVSSTPYEYRIDPKYKTWSETNITQLDVGNVYVTSSIGGCTDTGNNTLSILRNGKWLKFLSKGNVFFFEYDIDNDNFKEMYLLEHEVCKNIMKIYKINANK